MGMRTGNGKESLYSIYVNNTGGVNVRLYNQTGASSIAGIPVRASTSFNYSVAQASNPYDVIGAIAEANVANSALVWVTYTGVANVLLNSGTTAIAEGWFRVDTTASGYFYQAAAPTGLGAIATDDHFKETGHSLATVAAATAATCPIMLHFN
jgi:hypothetical protein